MSDEPKIEAQPEGDPGPWETRLFDVSPDAGGVRYSCPFCGTTFWQGEIGIESGAPTACRCGAMLKAHIGVATKDIAGPAQQVPDIQYMPPYDNIRSFTHGLNLDRQAAAARIMAEGRRDPETWRREVEGTWGKIKPNATPAELVELEAIVAECRRISATIGDQYQYSPLKWLAIVSDQLGKAYSEMAGTLPTFGTPFNYDRFRAELVTAAALMVRGLANLDQQVEAWRKKVEESVEGVDGRAAHMDPRTRGYSHPITWP